MKPDSSTNQIVLRDATAHDASFVDWLTRTVMESYVSKTWSGTAERNAYFEKNKFDRASTKIIQVNGKDIGRLSLIRSKDSLVLDNIHLLPEFQGKGIGTKIIEQVMNDAHAQGQSVALQVLRVNPAAKLYLKMGFKIYKREAERLYLRTERD